MSSSIDSGDPRDVHKCGKPFSHIEFINIHTRSILYIWIFVHIFVSLMNALRDRARGREWVKAITKTDMKKKSTLEHIHHTQSTHIHKKQIKVCLTFARYVKLFFVKSLYFIHKFIIVIIFFSFFSVLKCIVLEKDVTWFYQKIE